MYRMHDILHYLSQAVKAINDAIDAIDIGIPIDMVQIDFTKHGNYFGEIIGESVHENLINQLFSQFCLGK